MSTISIRLSGDDYSEQFHNDWDFCEKNGALHIEDLEGWYGGVGASATPDINRFRRHGKFPAPTIRGHRKLDLVVSWVTHPEAGEEGFRRFARRVSGIAWDRGPYRMVVNEDGFVLETDVQLDGEIDFQRLVPTDHEQAFRAKIPLRAPDPILLGPAKQFTLAPNMSSLHLEYPLFGPEQVNAAGQPVLNWGTSSQESYQITNLGNATTYPKFVITADDPAGVRVSFDGYIAEYYGPIFPQAPLTLDFAGGASIGGMDVSSSLTRRDWGGLARGATTTPTLQFLGGGFGFAEGSIRDAYI